MSLKGVMAVVALVVGKPDRHTTSLVHLPLDCGECIPQDLSSTLRSSQSNSCWGRHHSNSYRHRHHSNSYRHRHQSNSLLVLSVVLGAQLGTSLVTDELELMLESSSLELVQTSSSAELAPGVICSARSSARTSLVTVELMLESSSLELV